MRRRAVWMYGHLLWMFNVPEGRGQLNNGLAMGTGAGTDDLVQPTLVITDGNLTQNFDGIDIEFILAPHTEAPAAMVFFFPQYNSICLAEICNQCQHNVLTPRGAQVRDTLAWSEALDKMLVWVDRIEASEELSAWGPHHWPRWSRACVREYIEGQRDLYRDLHDQTVRLMNEGFSANGIFSMSDVA